MIFENVQISTFVLDQDELSGGASTTRRITSATTMSTAASTIGVTSMFSHLSLKSAILIYLTKLS